MLKCTGNYAWLRGYDNKSVEKMYSCRRAERGGGLGSWGRGLGGFVASLGCLLLLSLVVLVVCEVLGKH